LPRPRETRSRDWCPTRSPFRRQSRSTGLGIDRGVGHGQPSRPPRSCAGPGGFAGRSRGATGRQCFSPDTSRQFGQYSPALYQRTSFSPRSPQLCKRPLARTGQAVAAGTRHSTLNGAKRGGHRRHLRCHLPSEGCVRAATLGRKSSGKRISEGSNVTPTSERRCCQECQANLHN